MLRLHDFLPPGLVVLVTLAFLTPANAADRAAIEEAIHDSGPYPHPFALRLPAEFPISSATDWRLSVLRKLEQSEYAKVRVEAGRAIWNPTAGNESRIRANLDRKYEMVDYSLLLGTIDVSIDSIVERADGGVDTRIVEQLEPTFLSRLIGELLPEAVRRETFCPGSVRLQMQPGDGRWKITKKECESK